MRSILCASLCALVVAPAFALSSDREQPIEVTADRFNGDEVKQTAVYSGNVVVSQGSMYLQGTNLELRLTPKGYRQATITGGPAKFRQQRDPKGSVGPDEWVHAEAATIVYDEERDTITLTGQAKLSRTESGVEKDLTRGEKIVYDLRNARSTVEGGVVGGKRQRVSTVIAPRMKDSGTEVDRPSAQLKNSTKLSVQPEQP